MAAHNIPTDLKRLHPKQLSGVPQHSKYELKVLSWALNFQNPKPKADLGFLPKITKFYKIHFYYFISILSKVTIMARCCIKIVGLEYFTQ